MRRNICKAACFSMVVALALPGTAMSQQHAQLVDTGVILSAQQLEHSADANRLMGITPPYWTPSSDDIARLDGQLRPYLEGVTANQPKALDAKLESYKRQYLGYTDGGKKWIYVNSICKTGWKEDRFWLDDLVIVFDGGPCFFTVRYDLSSSQFGQLMINGPERWR